MTLSLSLHCVFSIVDVRANKGSSSNTKINGKRITIYAKSSTEIYGRRLLGYYVLNTMVIADFCHVYPLYVFINMNREV